MLSQAIPLILGHEKTWTSWLEVLKVPLYQVVTVYVRPSEEWGIKLRFLDKEMWEEGKEISERKGMERKNGQGGYVREREREKRRLARERGKQRMFMSL